MKIAILYQSDCEDNKDFMGSSLDQPLMKKFEEYLNKVQKYNFYSEDVSVNDYPSHSELTKPIVAVNESTYLHEYLLPYFEQFMAAGAEIS